MSWARAALVGCSLALAGSAVAAEVCEPLDEPEFRSLVLDAQAAIDRGNLELPGEILAEVEARIPCLTFAPAPRMWADLLVARAIVSFLEDSGGRGWKDSLLAATRIRPMVDRGVSSAHPMATWDPATDPTYQPPRTPPIVVPEGQQIYVDGIREATVPSSGVVLVQRTDGVWWNSILVDDDSPLPPGWLSAGVEQPRRVVVWARTGVTTGVGAAVQSTDWESDVFVEEVRGGPAAGVAGDLHVTLFSPGGFWVAGGVTPSVQTPGYHLRIAAIWTVGGLTFGAGGGTASIDTYERGQVLDASGSPAEDELRHDFLLLRYPLVTAMYRSRGPWSIDGAVSGGGAAALARLDLQAGVAPPQVWGQRFRLGADLAVTRGQLTPQGLPARTLQASGVRALLRLDIIWGEY